jgi:hypothetical protein
MKDENRTGLARSMSRFGDIAGITYNLRTGRLVTGHQRVNDLRTKHGDHLRLDMPKGLDLARAESAADLQFGHLIEPNGTRWRVRLVNWPERLEKAANVAANAGTISGEWVPELLRPLVEEIALDDSSFAEDLRLAELAPVIPPVIDGAEPESKSKMFIPIGNSVIVSVAAFVHNIQPPPEDKTALQPLRELAERVQMADKPDKDRLARAIVALFEREAGKVKL